MTTKLPDVADLDESEQPGHQQTRYRDAEKRQIGADHVDKRHQAAEKYIQEGDIVLLEKRKENKLSPHYEKEPYHVTARYGDQVQLKSPQGVDCKRNIQHVKGFVTPAIPDSVVVPCQHEQTTPSPSPEMSTVEHQSPIQPVKDQSPIQPQPQPQPLPRRSGRVTRPPKGFY